jgi:DNA-binding CsgD family transcriptional regulator
MYSESLALLRETDDRWRMAYSMLYLGIVHFLMLDVPSARHTVTEALAYFRALGDQWGATTSLNLLGDASIACGDAAGAQAPLAEALALSRQLGDQLGAARSLASLGYAALALADLPLARRYYEQSLSVVDDVGYQLIKVQCLAGLASIAATDGHAARATRLFGTVAAVLESVGSVQDGIPGVDTTRGLALARATLTPEQFDTAWAEGRAMSPERATAYARQPEPAQAPQLPAPAPGDRLSPREREVVRLLALGKSNLEIAEALSISHHTAGNHVAHILRKLELESRTAVAAWAVRHGIG